MPVLAIFWGWSASHIVAEGERVPGWKIGFVWLTRLGTESFVLLYVPLRELTHLLTHLLTLFCLGWGCCF